MATYTFEVDGVLTGSTGSDTTGLFGGTLGVLNPLGGMPYHITIVLNSVGSISTSNPNQSILSNDLPQSVTVAVGGYQYIWSSLSPTTTGEISITNNTSAFAEVGGQITQTNTVTGVASLGSLSVDTSINTTALITQANSVSLNNPISYNILPNDTYSLSLGIAGPTTTPTLPGGGYLQIGLSSGQGVIQHFSISTTVAVPAATKPKTLQNALTLLAKVSTLGFAFGGTLPKGGTPLALLLNTMSLLTGLGEIALEGLSKDPPDENYQAIATPSVPTISTSGLPATVAAGVTALAQLVAIENAMVTTYNRLSTASSDGNGYWEQQQLAAYQSYEGQAATAATTYSAAMPAISAYLASGLGSMNVSAANLTAFQSQLSSSSLSSSLALTATSLGIDSTTQAAIAALLTQADPNQAASLVTNGYSDTATQAELNTLASTWQVSSTGASPDTTAIQNVVTVSGTGSVLSPFSGFENIELISGAAAGSVIVVTAGYQAASVSGAASITLVDTSGGVLLSGGTGNTTLLSSAANDTLQAGGGGAVLVAFAGAALETGSGETASNLFFGGSTPVTIQGGGGNDTAVLSTGGVVTTGTGGSQVWLSTGSTVVNSNGADTVVGGSGTATVNVLGSSDVLAFGGSGTMLFNGGPGASTVVGFAASVTVNGGTGGGVFFGGTAGKNVLNSGSGQAVLVGGGSGDELNATGSAADVLVASNGSETLNGLQSSGSDAFFGGIGSDSLVGGTGANVFTAGPGNMTLVGGGTTDLYVFLAGATSDTQIQGFNVSHDFIKLSGFSAGATQSALDSATAFNGGTLIKLGDGTLVTFSGIAPGTITAANFI